MPVKSQAQRRWLHWAQNTGRLKKGTAKRWERETPKGRKLPKRVKKRSSNRKSSRSR